MTERKMKRRTTKINDEQKEIALKVLREKHFNGGVKDIHNQVFYELKKDKCPICDLPAFAFYEMEKYKLNVDMQTSTIFKAIERMNDKMVGGEYILKNKERPFEVECQVCHEKDRISASHVINRSKIDEPAFNTQRSQSIHYFDTNDWTCPSCFWNTIGQFV